MSDESNKMIKCTPFEGEISRQGLLTQEQASEMEDLFKIFANDTRLLILHALVLNDEMSVSQIAEALSANVQTISNQLQRLSSDKVVGSRRDGTTIYYRAVDPCVQALIEKALCFIKCRPDTTST